jgi:hypothetical protein
MAAGAALLSLTACGSSRTTHDQHVFSFHGTRLVIDDPASDLRLVPGKGSGIQAQRWLSGTAARPGHSSWTLRGDTLQLAVECSGLVLSCGSRFQVAVPPDASVVVHSGSGNDTVSGLSGPLRISAGSGNVTGSAIRSPTVRARSSAGNVDIGFATVPRLADVSCGTGNATARVPTAGHRYRVTVTAGGTAQSRVPDDHQSANLVQVSSGSGNATVLPVP